MREAFSWLCCAVFSTLFFLPPALAEETGVTANTIKIGIFGPLTGPASVFAKTIYGAAAVYKDINDRGGINGRKIDLVIEDDGCDPLKGIAAVKKLLSQDQVFMLHGAFCTSVALAIKPEIAKNHALPYMVLGAASADISTPLMANLFHPVPTSRTVSEKMAEFALSKPGVRKIAVIRHSDEWGMAFSVPAIAWLKERGITPVTIEALERGSTDATAQILAIKASAPDAVLAALYPPELTLYLRGAYKYALKATTIATNVDSIDDIDRRIGIPAAVKDVFVGYTLSDQVASPSLAYYASLLKKYYPSEALDSMGFYTMTGALAVAEALRRCGQNLTRQAFIGELNKLQHFSPGIFAGELSFSPTEHAGIKAIKLAAIVDRKLALFDTYPQR